MCLLAFEALNKLIECTQGLEVYNNLFVSREEYQKKKILRPLPPVGGGLCFLCSIIYGKIRILSNLNK